MTQFLSQSDRSFHYQCSAKVFKRAGRQFSERAFSALCSMIKKALTTVISAFYQHLFAYFCDGYLFDSSLFICRTIGYAQVNAKLRLFFGKKIFFLFGSLKGQGANFKILWKRQGAKKKGQGEHPAKSARQITDYVGADTRVDAAEWTGAGRLVPLAPNIAAGPVSEGHRVTDGVPADAEGARQQLPSLSGAHHLWVTPYRPCLGLIICESPPTAPVWGSSCVSHPLPPLSRTHHLWVTRYRPCLGLIICESPPNTPLWWFDYCQHENNLIC